MATNRSRDTATATAEVDPRDLAALHSDGADLSDAVALWNELENPEEMLREAGRVER